MSTKIRYLGGIPSILKSMLLILVLGFSAQSLGATISWTVVITPAGGGKVPWQTNMPAKSGTLVKSGVIKFENGAAIDLTFQANEGFKLERVTKNLDDWTPYLDANKHYQFGPVSKAHVIVASFAEINPEAALIFEPPAVLPPDVAPIFDATGHYSGTLPVGSHRTFDAYAAMDESGKIDILPNMSTLQGYTSDPSNKPVSGVLKTIDNKPDLKVSGKLLGTRDGVAGEVAGTGALTDIQADPSAVLMPAAGAVPGAAALDQPMEQVLNAEAVAGYKVVIKTKQTGKKLSLSTKALPVALPVTTNVTREWSVNVMIQQRLDAKKKTRTYASALLTLPNGDQISFAERVVKYSRKVGYSLAFVKGKNLSTNKIDKKTSITIKKMLFSCVVTNCTLNDGEIQYSFLGQKGKAKLMDFVVQPTSAVEN
ncbi:MAG: hypothetical protein NTV43_09130 [Methylococcales bacterium]|nr:hypothetical protein [Methylococcales bacterium]